MIEYNKSNGFFWGISEKGQVSEGMEYKELLLTTITAGFYRAYGLRSKGFALSMDISNSIGDDTYDISKRNILVWNLYVLAREFTENENWNMAFKYIERAEKNWSRDVILGDELGVYHVSWLEQLFLERARLCMNLGRRDEFKKITETILKNRLEIISHAEKEIGEKDIKDRCIYSCYELIALESKVNRDMKYANKMIMKALEYKGIYLEALKVNGWETTNTKMPLQHLFRIYHIYYRNVPNHSFDNMAYGYCTSCIYFKDEEICDKTKMKTNRYRACSKYRGI